LKKIFLDNIEEKSTNFSYMDKNSLFKSSELLHKIIQNSNNENLVLLSLEENYEIVKHINFELSNPTILSVCFYSFKTPKISIKFPEEFNGIKSIKFKLSNLKTYSKYFDSLIYSEKSIHLIREYVEGGNSVNFVYVDGKENYIKVWKSAGHTFEGELKNGNLNGNGKSVYSSGDIYKGEFKDGCPNGKGKIFCCNGNTYEGEFKDGSPNGKGKLIKQNGDSFDGEFKNGLPNGKGKLIEQYKIFEGDFKNGILDGKGKSIYSNGEIFEGEFKNGLPYGKGKSINSDGDIYEGEFIDGIVINGKGKKIKSNGDVLEGEFKNGVFIGDVNIPGYEVKDKDIKYISLMIKNLIIEFINSKNNKLLKRGSSVEMTDLKKHKNFLEIEKNILILISKLHLLLPSLFSSELFSLLLSANSSSQAVHLPPTTHYFFGIYKIHEKILNGLLVIESLFFFFFLHYIFITFNKNIKWFLFINRRRFVCWRLFRYEN
jgi:hypothetical protein